MKIIKTIAAAILLTLTCNTAIAQNEKLTDYVNPFIGSSNYGTTTPGALCPNGMMNGLT